MSVAHSFLITELVVCSMQNPRTYTLDPLHVAR